MADTYPDTNPSSPYASGIGSVPISFASVDQDLSKRRVRGLLISTAGTLKVTWADASVDTLVLGVGFYVFDITLIWHTGSSGVVGNVIY